MATIVVGVDGSDASKEALEWAIREAGARGTSVVALHAWSYPVMISPLTGAAAPDFDFQRSARKALDEIVGDVVAGAVVVEKRLVEGGAAAALLHAAQDADLLVVGSRGLGGFSGLLLGSVGQQCVHHAPCPVVVIPHGRSAR